MPPSILVKKRYGLIPGFKDYRDFPFTLKPSTKPQKIPAHTNLRPLCGPVFDQGQLGSCTANAILGAYQYLQNKENLPQIPLSRLFLYFNERFAEHTVPLDNGAMIRTGIKSLANQGACPETEWPYDIRRFAEEPPVALYSDALSHQALLYQKMERDLTQMRGCLAEGFPFVIGFSVYSGFESDSVARTGELHIPVDGEQFLGGHAVLIVGHNDAHQRFIVRNSWGTNWGIQGYFYMPYQYLMDQNLSQDFWVIKKAE